MNKFIQQALDQQSQDTRLLSYDEKKDRWNVASQLPWQAVPISPAPPKFKKLGDWQGMKDDNLQPEDIVILTFMFAIVGVCAAFFGNLLLNIFGLHWFSYEIAAPTGAVLVQLAWPGLAFVYAYDKYKNEQTEFVEKQSPLF
jgi:hypothetical protein